MAGRLETELGNGADENTAILTVLKEVMNQHGAVVFGGNGYSDEWHKMAVEERGLANLRTTADARVWAQALVYAEQGQEAVKIEGAARAADSGAALGGGFARRIEARPWQEGVARVTVTVTLPDGASFAVDRLVPSP